MSLFQANGTVDCREILKAWEPVREAADLSPNTTAMWCSTSLQPVLEVYTSIQNDYSTMNMSVSRGMPNEVMLQQLFIRIVKCLQLTVLPLGVSVGTQRKWLMVRLHSVPSLQQMMMGPAGVRDTAERIVEAAQSLYQVNINRTLVVNQFITNVSARLSVLAGQSVSPEAQLHWLQQLQDIQLQDIQLQSRSDGFSAALLGL